MFKNLAPMFLVDDVDEAIEWYKEVFDAKINATDPENPPYEWVSLLIGDVEIMFAKKESAIRWYSENVKINENISNFIAYIYVEGIDELYQKIKERTEIIMEPLSQWYGIKEFAIKAPFGMVLVFAEVLENKRKVNYKIIGKVIQIKGVCSAGYRIGDEIDLTIPCTPTEFEEWREKPKICPHLFTSIFPIVFAFQAGGKIPWEDEEGNIEVMCPDPVNTVVLRLIRMNKK